ncbi:MAG: S41 family peptidase [Christensenellaceae bacterium]
MEKKKVVVLCAAIAVTVCFITALFTYNYVTSQERGNEIRIGSGNYDDIAKYMDMSDLEQIIQNTYYQEVSDESLVDGAMKGMVRALGDPYSVYYTEEEYGEYTSNREGIFVGIGVTVSPYEETGQLLVQAVYSGGPADMAGLNEGDIITAVDNSALIDLDFESATDILRGPSGSNVRITILTPEGETRDMNLVRAEVQTQYVFPTMLDEDLAYIIVNEFRGNAAEEFADALAFAAEEEAKGIVIDLRGNMGGNVSDAVSMLDQLLPEGILVYSIDKNGDRNEWTSDASMNDIPIAVIVDENSASASEIFAGAVQDYGRGPIVGTQTFGKGVTQVTLDMPHSGGGVKLTNAVYYTPNGRDINGIGITPDKIVELPEDTSTLTQDTDSQLQAAMTALREQIES